MHTVVPVEHKGKMVFCIVIHDEGLVRIEGHDPAVVEGATLVQALRGTSLPLEMVDFLVCYEPDREAFARKCRDLREPNAILRYLCRNWSNKPGDTGDAIKIRM